MEPEQSPAGMEVTSQEGADAYFEGLCQRTHAAYKKQENQTPETVKSTLLYSAALVSDCACLEHTTDPNH